MSVHLSIYLGPVLEVRERADILPFEFDCGDLSEAHNMGAPHETIDGVEWRIRRFTPNVHRPREPVGMYITSDREDSFQEVEERDPVAERAWFRLAFASAIDDIIDRAGAGARVVVRWGLLKSCS